VSVRFVSLVECSIKKFLLSHFWVHLRSRHSSAIGLFLSFSKGSKLMNFDWSSLQLFLVAVKFFCPTLYFFPAFCLLDFLQTQIQLFQLFPDFCLTALIFSLSIFVTQFWSVIPSPFFSRSLGSFLEFYRPLLKLVLSSSLHSDFSPTLYGNFSATNLASSTFSLVSESFLFLSRNQNLEISLSFN